MDEQKMEQKPDERRLPERLLAIQNELKAPKGQYNSFGKYKYRSAEDILEAVKPLAEQHSVLIYCSDDIVMVGNRIYVKATATAEDVTGRCSAITVTAFAREPDDKKGMDASQITGTASSYARKYALNGLLCIDDAKDADTDAYQTAGVLVPTMHVGCSSEICTKAVSLCSYFITMCCICQMLFPINFRFFIIFFCSICFSSDFLVRISLFHPSNRCENRDFHVIIFLYYFLI